MSILALPVEIQAHILDFISWHDHFFAAEVCPLWNSILQLNRFRSRRHYKKGYLLTEAMSGVMMGSCTINPGRSQDEKLENLDAHGILLGCVLVIEILKGGESAVLLRVKPSGDKPHGRDESLADKAEGVRLREGVLGGALKGLCDIQSSLLVSDRLSASNYGSKPPLEAKQVPGPGEPPNLGPGGEDYEGPAAISRDRPSGYNLNLIFDAVFKRCSTFGNWIFDPSHALWVATRGEAPFRNLNLENYGGEKSLQDLINDIIHHVEYHMFCYSEVLGCWCTVYKDEDDLRCGSGSKPIKGHIRVYVEVLVSF